MRWILFICVWMSGLLLNAQDTTMKGRMYQYSIGIQIGQPHHITGADVVNDDQPFNVLHGNLNRFSMGSGLFFRWHTDESFSLHARLSYSTRRYSLYDSIADPDVAEEFPNWTNTISRSYVTDNSYRMNNVLMGIGGGHEGHYGKFIVRAGGEIDFIKYSDVTVVTQSRNYTLIDSDTVSSGGHYNSSQRILFRDQTTSPGLWAIGIVGHASLEYKVNSHLGIGANIYLGGFYCGTKSKTWKQEVNTVNSYSDSVNQTQETSSEAYSEHPYSVNQFDFSPLNAQINVVYYFCWRYINRGSF